MNAETPCAATEPARPILDEQDICDAPSPSDKEPPEKAQDTPFASTHRQLAIKLAAEGRKGFRLSADQSALLIDSVDAHGNHKTVCAKFNDVQQREKIAFILRTGGYCHASHFGTRLAIEMPVSNALDPDKPSRRFADCAILRDRPGHLSGPRQTLSLAENKIRSANKSLRQCIDEGITQLSDSARNLAEAGLLGPACALSLVIWDEQALADPNWKSSDYLNSISGKEKLCDSPDALEKFAADNMDKHRMFVATWLVRTADANGKRHKLNKFSLANEACANFVLPYCDRLPLLGQPGTGAANKALDARISPACLMRLPFYNPMPGGNLQNTRDLMQMAVYNPASDRLREAGAKSIDYVKNRVDLDSVRSSYDVSQTGANARRVCACAGKTLHHLQQEDDGSHWLDLVSCDVALFDGQSSSAAFGFMALAALRAPTSFDAFCSHVSAEALPFGIDLNALQNLEAKIMENASGPEQKAERMRYLNAVLAAGEFPVIIEFADNQQQAAQNARKANLATSQSSADLVGVQYRDRSRDVLRLYNGLAQKHSDILRARMHDTKSAKIEPETSFPVSELSTFEYLAACANPKLYFEREVTEKSARAQSEKLPLATAARQPAADGTLAKCAKKDDAALQEALAQVWRARETLHRSLFEAATHAKEVAEVYNRCLPKSGNALRCLDAIMAQVDETAQSSTPYETLQTAYSALKFAENSMRRTPTRKIDGKTKKKVLEEIDGMRKTLENFEELGHLRYASDVQNHLRSLHMRAAMQLQNADQTDFVAKLACLIHACHEQALAFSKTHAHLMNIPVWPLTRILLGSVLYSYHDSCLAEAMSLKNSASESAKRAEHARTVLQSKFERVHLHKPSKISTQLLKKLATLTLEACDAGGLGHFAPALPALWRQNSFDPHACANVWLMHCGISADGALLPGFTAPALALQPMG